MRWTRRRNASAFYRPSEHRDRCGVPRPRRLSGWWRRSGVRYAVRFTPTRSSLSLLGQRGGVERAGPGEISFEYSGRNLALQRNECSSAPEFDRAVSCARHSATDTARVTGISLQARSQDRLACSSLQRASVSLQPNGRDDCLAADQDTTIQLPYGLGRHPVSGHNVGRSPLCEVVMRKLEHSDALRQRASWRTWSTTPERAWWADSAVALIRQKVSRLCRFCGESLTFAARTPFPSRLTSCHICRL